MDTQSEALAGTKRQRSRDQLLVAAQSILLESGTGGLGIREVANRAGMVHASFYNYFDSIAALLDDLASLFLATHGMAVRRLVAGIDDPVVVFSRTTHVSLGYFAEAKDYGAILFDSGLPIDRLAQGLRPALRIDLEAGRSAGRFVFADTDTVVSLVTGAVIGLALDLHRGRLARGAIAPAIEKLLVLLGLTPDGAYELAGRPAEFPDPPELPLRWMAIAGL